MDLGGLKACPIEVCRGCSMCPREITPEKGESGEWKTSISTVGNDEPRLKISLLAHLEPFHQFGSEATPRGSHEALVSRIAIRAGTEPGTLFIPTAPACAFLKSSTIARWQQGVRLCGSVGRRDFSLLLELYHHVFVNGMIPSKRKAAHLLSVA